MDIKETIRRTVIDTTLDGVWACSLVFARQLPDRSPAMIVNYGVHLVVGVNLATVAGVPSGFESCSTPTHSSARKRVGRAGNCGQCHRRRILPPATDTARELNADRLCVDGETRAQGLSFRWHRNNVKTCAHTDK